MFHLTKCAYRFFRVELFSASHHPLGGLRSVALVGPLSCSAGKVDAARTFFLKFRTLAEPSPVVKYLAFTTSGTAAGHEMR